MIIGYHVILSAYGFWLPNDPRGSWSDFVRSWELLRYGPATKVDTRQSVAARPHNRALRLAAKKALTYPPVHFSGVQARAIGRGFRDFVQRSGLVVWACAILPEHTHLVIGRHRYKAEQVANLLKGAATRQLVAEGIHPFQNWAEPDGRVPRCWAAQCWIVFIDQEAVLRNAIQYVERNPLKEGKPFQRWPFVTSHPCSLFSGEPKATATPHQRGKL
jgi:REP element-mobilizing transposase RayT